LPSVIQLRPLVSRSAEETFASRFKDEDILAHRPEVIAELQSYLDAAHRPTPAPYRCSWRARLKVLADFL
jgi:hypothetical protein